jgi:aminoglycoside 6-adenylyltransferase
MLTWYVGMQTQFSRNPGKFGKYFEQYLEPGLWDMLQETYADAGYDNTWEALGTMCALFRLIANRVAGQLGFDYPHDDDERVSAHLEHVRLLPKNSTEMY